MNKMEICITGIIYTTHIMVFLLCPVSTIDISVESHDFVPTFIIDEGFSAVTHSYLPRCRAEQRRRLRRRRIWLWGRDHPPGRAPASRLPDPSAAWSGSRSLDGQEMTVGGGKRWEPMLKHLLPFRILFKEKKKGGLRKRVTASERGEENNLTAQWIYWGALTLI